MKLSGLSDAPPTRTPSMSACEIMPFVLSALTLPPYRMMSSPAVFVAEVFLRESAYESADLFGVGVARGLAGAYSPYRLVGDYHFMSERLSVYTFEPLDELPLDNVEGFAALALLERFTDAENGDEAAVYRGVYLFIKLFVGFAEYVASLAVAYEDVRRAYLGNHRAGGLAGEGSALFPVHIFRADYYGQFFCRVYRRQQRNCGNEEGYLFGSCGYGFLYLFRVLQFGAEFAKEFTCRRRAVVHLPVSGDEFSAHFIFLQLSSYRRVRKSRRNGHFPTPLGALL